MKRFLSGMLVTVLLLAMMSMSVFAAGDPDYILSPEYMTEATTAEPNEPKDPGDDELMKDKDKDKSKAPKTSDERMVIYMAVMAAIAVTGTVVIASRKEN